MASPAIQLSGLAQKLVNDHLIDKQEAETAAQQATDDKLSLVSYLVKNDLVSARAIANSAAEEFGTPLIDLEAVDLEAIPKQIISERLIRTHRAIPLYHRGNRLFVALSDPTNRQALADIQFQTGISTEEVLVEEDKLNTFINRVLESEEDTSFTDLGDEDIDLDLESVNVEGAEEEEEAAVADDTPVVRFINKMLLDAIRMGSSDLHFEPFEKSYRVRFRTDGVLHEMASPPNNLAPRIAARIKVMSQMDISERRIPQDGRIKLKVSKTKAIDFRVNSLPVLFGEKIVLRILDPSQAKMGIDALGYEPDQKELYLEALEKPQGMFLRSIVDGHDLQQDPGHRPHRFRQNRITVYGHPIA